MSIPLQQIYNSAKTPPNNGFPYHFHSSFTTVQGVLDDEMACCCYLIWSDDYAVATMQTCDAIEHDCICMLFAGAGFYEIDEATDKPRYLTRYCIADNHHCLCDMEHHAYRYVIYDNLGQPKKDYLTVNIESCRSTTHTTAIPYYQIMSEVHYRRMRKLKTVLFWTSEQKPRTQLPKELIKYIAELTCEVEELTCEVEEFD